VPSIQMGSRGDGSFDAIHRVVKVDQSAPSHLNDWHLWKGLSARGHSLAFVGQGEMLLVEQKRWEGCPVFFGPCTPGRTWGTRPGEWDGLVDQALLPNLVWNPGSVYLDRFESLPSPFDKLRAGSAGLKRSCSPAISGI